MKCEATQELQMRAERVPMPTTKDELLEYLDSLVERQHDYGTTVYAMSMAAVAAFNYVAKKEGVTGFQANIATLDVIRRLRGFEHGFMLVDYAKLLYPQYNVLKEVAEGLEEVRPQLAKVAAELLAKRQDAHPEVVAHWREMANDEVNNQQESEVGGE
jgi:hypothetical protein